PNPPKHPVQLIHHHIDHHHDDLPHATRVPLQNTGRPAPTRTCSPPPTASSPSATRAIATTRLARIFRMVEVQAQQL
ncbi:hypothetical protein, partial [Amycolatopsis sp. NPDC051372]|uniref:hypothetical protein n=1 Tax=Amycolatopsis sp. NPDC051372 TaxID=3155669 RepID=UPI00341DED1B